MIQEILTHYKDRFQFENFYDNLLYNISKWPEYHIKSDNFLKGYVGQNIMKEPGDGISTKAGDIRVDLPIWFGDPSVSIKIVILGLEPRATDDALNIECVKFAESYVFATPFALEKDRGPYKTAFCDLIQQKDVFAYFTDVVKTYQVTGNKRRNDEIGQKIISAKRPKRPRLFA